MMGLSQSQVNELAATLVKMNRLSEDAVAYRFLAGESLDDIRKVYGWDRDSVERHLRSYMNRDARYRYVR
jgi:hypothetical protein